VVKQGNNYLVNGNVLHLQASYIFNRMLKPTLAQPFFGYGAVGTRSAFFALRDTPLQVTLPLPDKAQLRVTRYGADGRRQSVEVSSYHAPLKTRLRKHELLIAEPVKK